MANEKRHIGLFGVAGVLVAALIIAGFVFGGNFLVSGKGVLTIQIMDDPIDLRNLYLTVEEVRIQGEDESWTVLDLDLSEPFDLLALQDVSDTLSETEILAGDYVMIEIQVKDSATAVSNDDPPEDLTVPSSVIKILLKPHLHIDRGAEVTILIDLQPDLETIGISHSLNLKPVVKAVVSQ